MAINITDILSENGLITAINQRFTQIEEAINEDLLWRTEELAANGNVMLTDLDMAENRILNLPAPVAPTEPVRKADLDAATMPGAYDHGLLLGLTDDDHPQYHNDARGDARYLLSQNGPFTEGSVLFADLAGNVDENPTTFYRDPVTGYLGVGNDAPSAPVHASKIAGQGVAVRAAANAQIITDSVGIEITDLSRTHIDSEIRSTLKDFGSSNLEFHNKVSGVKTKTGEFTETGRLQVSGGIATGNETAPDTDSGGACFNQGASNNKIVTFKSSTVTQPFTSLAETDTYAYFQPNGATGGVNLTGMSSASTGFFFRGLATTPLTGFNQNGVMTFDAAKSDGGTGRTVIADSENVFTLTNNNTRLLQVKGSGVQILLNGLSTGAEEAPDVDAGGICVNHGSSDGLAFTIKNSDIAHTYATIEADTYYSVGKFSAAAGGAQITGLGESSYGIYFRGIITTANTGTGAAAIAPLYFDGRTMANGAIGTTENLMVISTAGNARISFKGNGDIRTAASIATGGEETPDVDPGGICINHGSADGFALTFKNSDVAHGMTSIAETDTYGAFGKRDPANGGMLFYGFGDADRAVEFDGFVTTENTAFTGPAAVVMRGATKNGTTIQPMSSTANIATVLNNTTVAAAFKGNGNLELLGGIKLSNTGNVLDRYEEGTWTPVISGSATPGSHTYTSQNGQYVRIGKLVFVSCYVHVGTKDAAMDGSIRIGGLPFAISNETNNFPSCSLGIVDHISKGTGDVVMGYGVQNNTIINLVKNTFSTTGSSASVAAADIGNNPKVSLALVYKIA